MRVVITSSHESFVTVTAGDERSREDARSERCWIERAEDFGNSLEVEREAHKTFLSTEFYLY